MPTFKSKLTADELRSAMSYDPATGIFDRKTKRSWNACGSAGRKSTGKYLTLRVNGVPYLAHRLAWLHYYGRWPKEFVDHINGDGQDNRIANLREADSCLNRENLREARSDNQSSGVLGVHWSAYHKKWKAHIRVAGKLMHLKYCNTVEEAQAVYVAAKRSLHAGCTL